MSTKFNERAKRSLAIIKAAENQKAKNNANAAERQESNAKRVENVMPRLRELSKILAAREAAKAPPPANMPLPTENTHAYPNNDLNHQYKGLSPGNANHLKKIMHNIAQKAAKAAKGGRRRRTKKKLTKKNRSRKSK